MHDVKKVEGRFSDTSIKYSNMLAYYGTDFATDNAKNSEGSQLQQTIQNKVKGKVVGLFSFQCYNLELRSVVCCKQFPITPIPVRN
jgi:hypothetical protein